MSPIKIPTLIGHRGWPAHYPENTLEGFAAAVGAGARWLECDIQLSADHLPFVAHDESLRRTADINRNINEMTSAELTSVTVSERRRFGGRYTDAKLPALNALIAWLKSQPQVRLFVEIKRQSLQHFGRNNVVHPVLAACRTALQQCTIISFDHACLTLARSHGASTIGWATEVASQETQGIAQILKPDYLFTSDEAFTDMQKTLKGPWRWIVYETQDPQRALQLTAQGAAFVETNDIGAMLKSPEFAKP